MRTKNLNAKNLLCASIAAITFAGTSPAAVACCGDGAAVAAFYEKTTLALSGVIEGAAILLKAWLERMNTTIASGFGKVLAGISQQTAAIRTMQEGSAAVQASLMMTKAAADAQAAYAVSPRVCFEIAAGSTAASAASAARQTQASLGAGFLSRSLHTANTTAALTDFQTTETRPDFESASYSPDQALAMREFVTRLVDPTPTQLLSRTAENSPQGRQFIAGQYIQQARASVAAYSLGNAIAERTPVKGLGTAAMLDRPDVSMQELLESQVRGRFESPAWYRMVAGLSKEGLLREAVKIQGLHSEMDLERYRSNERIETLLATTLAINANNDSQQRLQEARRIATKEKK